MEPAKGYQHYLTYIDDKRNADKVKLISRDIIEQLQNKQARYI